MQSDGRQLSISCNNWAFSYKVFRSPEIIQNATMRRKQDDSVKQTGYVFISVKDIFTKALGYKVLCELLL